MEYQGKREISKMWAEVIRPAMTRNHVYNQKQLAKAAGISGGTIANIKYGTFKRIHLKTLEALASTLKINITKLMVCIDKGKK